MASLPISSGAQIADDPFTTNSPRLKTARQRYSGFNSQQFSVYSDSSPSQITSVLKAHLAETDRRLNEASSFGTQLLQQRKDLCDRISDVENIPPLDELTPELRQKLSSLEREVNLASKESARIFLPKTRVASGDSENDPAVLAAAHQYQLPSPSKLHAQSRRLRNHTPSRVNDVKLATEISDALLTQVRELQAACAEKDEAYKQSNAQLTQAEHDLEAVRNRNRQLDENEQRYKDENWVLEMKLHEQATAHKEVSDREIKLIQGLKTAQSDQSAMQRELEDLKEAHGELTENHTLLKKQTDSEIATLRRNADGSENELLAMHKKIENLTAQNRELAVAFTAKHREAELATFQGHESGFDTNEDDQLSSDSSLPPSPSKATPRHGGLESETIKSSLHHAQRQIQHLKNIIHREKSEKFELRRMLQDSREELESKRKGEPLAKKKSKPLSQSESKNFLRTSKIGTPTTEIFIADDDDWEDDKIDTPSKRATTSQTSTAYATATEGSEAFETANERDQTTESEAFFTGVEPDSEGDLTETESSSKVFGGGRGHGHGQAKVARQLKKSSPRSLTQRHSFMSTASASDDDDDDFIDRLKTPQPQQSKFRVRINRASRKITQKSQDEAASPAQSPFTTFQSSPATASSASNTPQGKSLFAELEDMSDGESERSSTPQTVQMVQSPSQSPLTLRKITSPLSTKLRAVQSIEQKRDMVDSSTMTDSAKIVSIDSSTMTDIDSFVSVDIATMTTSDKITLVDSVTMTESIIPNTIDSSNMTDQVEEYASKAVAAGAIGLVTGALAGHDYSSEPIPQPKHQPQIALVRSVIFSQSTEPTEPVIEKIVHPSLGISPILSLHTPPADSNTMLQQLTISAVSTLNSIPVEQKLLNHKIQQSVIASQSTEPSQPEHDILLRRMRPTLLELGTQTDSPKSKENVTLVTKGTQSDDMMTMQGNGDLPCTAMIPDKIEEQKSIPISETSEIQKLSGSTQTMLSSKDIDQLVKSQGKDSSDAVIFGSTSPRKPRESVKRPGSSDSNRSALSPPPPLPAKAKQFIAAAQRTVPQMAPSLAPPIVLSATSAVPVSLVPAVVQPAPAALVIPAVNPPVTVPTASPLAAAPGLMGPPLMPVSSYAKTAGSVRRTRTPTGSVSSPSKHKHTPSASTTAGRNVLPSPVTRRSSISSFASELDVRFNIARPTYDAPSTDPRMMQAVVQTMIGEWLWKYTRHTFGGDFSTQRHRRYFWIHPYTRTLYWSSKDPCSGERTEVKAKSVPIESVRVVSDNNPSPPGLYYQSIILKTTGRSIKLTAQTGQRHETWFNALVYLLRKQDTADTEENEQHNNHDASHATSGAPTIRSSSRFSGASSTMISRRAVSPSTQYPTLRPNARSGQNHAENADTITNSSVRGILSTPSNGGSVTHRSRSVQPYPSNNGYNARNSSVASRFSSVFRTPQASIRGSMMSGSESTRAGNASGSTSQASRHTYEAGRGVAAANSGAEDQSKSKSNATVGRKSSAENMRRTFIASSTKTDGYAGMENVRACCNGKHDVGSLSQRLQTHHHGHNTGTARKRVSLAGSIASRFGHKSEDTIRRGLHSRDGGGGLESMDPASMVG